MVLAHALAWAQVSVPVGKPATPANSAMLSPKARAFLCADPGHEDGVPPAVSAEMLAALRAQMTAGLTMGQAIARLSSQVCEPPAIGKP